MVSKALVPFFQDCLTAARAEACAETGDAACAGTAFAEQI
jgi:hypothetical protein